MGRVGEDDEALAHTLIGILELTSLNAGDTAERIVALCERASTPVGNVAAVCVLPRFVGLARRTLDSLRAHEVRVVAMVNYPTGGARVSAVESQTQAAMLAGADEIDLVYPFHAHLGGDRRVGGQMIAACNARCERPGMLTITLEAGVLRDPQTIYQVCRTAILEGAAFLKTSTGRQIANATAQAARIMIESIADKGPQVGFKVAGNIRTMNEARFYIDMAESRFGPLWLESGRLRLGAGSLLDDLLAHLGVRL